MLTSLTNFLLFSLRNIPMVFLGWLHLAREGFLFIYEFWNQKLALDKIFFALLLLQLICSGVSWFHYDVRFLDMPETVYISPKWNFFFILLSLLNFFFLGFWKASWIRIWFFSTQMMMIILIFWGYLEPTRYFFDFINPSEIQYGWIFYIFAITAGLTFIIGYFTFQDEDRRFEIN